MKTSTRLFLTIAALSAATGWLVAAEPIAIHAGGDFRKLTREECNAKAMATLRDDQKFAHIEQTADGFVLGWNDIATVLVTAFPYRDGSVILVTAMSKDKFEAERLRDQVREFVLDPNEKPNLKPIKLATHKVAKPNGLAVNWGVERHGILSTVRFFEAAASIAMEKHGLKSASVSKTMVFGGSGECGMVVVLVPGANDLSVQFLVISVSEDVKESKRLQQSIQKELLKVLFD